MDFTRISLTRRPKQVTDVSLILRLAFSVFLVACTLSVLSMKFDDYEMSSRVVRFLHNVNTPFHEFGHILFRPFPRVIVSLGGTLGQLLMPLICAAAILLTSKDPFGASAALWWMFESLVDCAPYIADARAGEAPLLGGNYGKSAPYGFHDWQFILGESGLLKMDRTIAQAAYWIGIAGMALALAWGLFVLFNEYRAYQQAGREGRFR